MSFVTETGEGLSNATSYVSVAEADAYHEQFGNLDWPETDLEAEDEGAAIIALKELALNKATRAVDLLFGQRYASYPAFPTTQSLLFPRALFYINSYQPITNTSIPRLLKDAVAEIALMVFKGEEIYPDVSESRMITEQSVKIGDLQTSTKYAGTVTDENLQGFYKIELLLGPLLALPSSGGEVFTHFRL